MLADLGLSAWHVALLLLLAWVIYGAIWRLFWSPLAGFPGPKSVALTHWVEFYYDVIKGGMFMWEIQKMHAKYGWFPLSAVFLEYLPDSFCRPNRPHQPG